MYTKFKINFSALIKQTLKQLQYVVFCHMDYCYSFAIAIKSRKKFFALSAVELLTISTLQTKFVIMMLKSINKWLIIIVQLNSMMMKYCMTEKLVTTPVHLELGILKSMVLIPMIKILHLYPHLEMQILIRLRILISV